MHKRRPVISEILKITLAVLLAAVMTLAASGAASVQAAPAKNLQKGSVRLLKSSFVWTGKAIQPKVTVKAGKKTLKQGRDYTVKYRNNKAVGKATAIVKGKGKYKGSVKKTFQIVPKSTALVSLKSNVYSLTATWKKQAKQTSGYQIQCSTNSKFQGDCPILTISGNQNTEIRLKGLKADTDYFVRIRTYQKIGNSQFVSAWSKAFKGYTLPDQNSPDQDTEEPEPSKLSMAAANAEIGLQILRERLSENSSANLLVSPLSLYEDLAMAAGGAKGETLKELEAYLGNSVSEAASMSKDWNQSVPDSLHVANSIWINEIYGQPKAEFQKNAALNFKAKIASVPYDMNTVQEINAWVKENTHGMIPALVDQLSPGEVMHLINAVAFEAEWKVPYEEPDIRTNSTFTNASGQKETCVMLRSTEAEYLSLSDKEGNLMAQGFLKPYGDGRTAFLGLLPEEGKTPKDLLCELDGESFLKMYQAKSVYQGGSLYAGIPEFSLDDKVQLKPILQKAGVQEAFLESADFSGMMQEVPQLYIDSVLQKTHIEVDRNGTKAAAATDIGVKAGSAMGRKDLTLILNRPFVYAIVDYGTGLPVFTGVQNSIK